MHTWCIWGMYTSCRYYVWNAKQPTLWTKRMQRHAFMKSVITWSIVCVHLKHLVYKKCTPPCRHVHYVCSDMHSPKILSRDVHSECKDMHWFQKNKLHVHDMCTLEAQSLHSEDNTGIWCTGALQTTCTRCPSTAQQLPYRTSPDAKTCISSEILNWRREGVHTWSTMCTSNTHHLLIYL
jgi:hypothetical protein